jgi:uncharacterized membrane protein (TIGR02234 family)
VLVGLAAGVLAAVSGTNAWVTAGQAEQSAAVAVGAAPTLGESPLGAALALVVLACWGVLLVTRGRFRRAVAWLAAVVGVGFAATVAAAPWTLDDQVADAAVGVTSPDVSVTGWWWAAAVAAVLVVASAVAAVAWVRHWPEMGSRYDAPTDAASGAGAARRAEAETNLDMWKALDEGRDPTE